MVDLLTKSNCSRYVEFKAVSKICIYQSGTIEQVCTFWSTNRNNFEGRFVSLQVPCSRADVFGSKSVSMLEKRKMMKFLSYCSTYDEDSNLEGIFRTVLFIHLEIPQLFHRNTEIDFRRISAEQ